ncbi:hypothetical protein KBD09_02480 [Candidatus Woesebacteria bacterium]|nr:hypothetical protein [Candidatus Woesebacteria bacterium]
MNIDRGLDLTDKAAWHPDNADRIAGQYGYEADGIFAQALDTFVTQIVEPARVTDLFPAVAKNFFGKHQPPLTRLG